MSKIIKTFKEYINNILSINEIKNILVDKYYNEIKNSSKYDDLKKLNRFEFQVFSQNGEDGIIEEIFNRIGTSNKIFVEFGVGNGLENNTLYLLLNNWSGLWIECNKKNISNIKKKFKSKLVNKELILKETIVTAENIEQIFSDSKIPSEFDLLSIDIDGNDYWVWEAIKIYKPRVIVIEYNAIFPANKEWIIDYKSTRLSDGSSFFGASLKAYENLGNKKGYKLVGCNIIGNNAFFVREDLVKNKFSEPFNSDNHYEPPRYFAVSKMGLKRNIID